MQCIHVHLILCLVLHLMQCDALMTVWACGSNLGLVCSPAVLLLTNVFAQTLASNTDISLNDKGEEGGMFSSTILGLGP